MAIQDIITVPLIMGIIDTKTNIRKIILQHPEVQNLMRGFRQSQSPHLLHLDFLQNTIEVGYQDLDHQDFLEVNK